MADVKLPAGYFYSDGKPIEYFDEETKEVLRVVEHPKGVIVGPDEPAHPKERKFTCRFCGNSFKKASDMAVCDGSNVQVVPEEAEVKDGKIVFTNDDAYGIKKGDVFRDDVYNDNGQARWQHGRNKLVEGYILDKMSVIHTIDETHGPRKMEVGS